MMKLKEYSLLLVLCLLVGVSYAQSSVSIKVIDANTLNAIKNAEVYNINTMQTYNTDANGLLKIRNLPHGDYELMTFAQNYQMFQEEISITADQQIQLTIKLSPLEIDLTTVYVDGAGDNTFAMRQLRAVEGTSIYAGKKTEVVLLAKLTANIASNNARQIYSQVTGLNIYESDDAGLQLSVGGRGLDPNRTASFNTRQNGYDISADVLGYPESYYTPPAEALQQIQVVRGAASLQYGTQFGGLLNFIFKQPNREKKIEWTSRQTGGSFGLFTSFNSLSGTVGKFSYYTYFNYKRGDGFRPNSGFDSYNYFTHLSYAFSEKTSLDIEFTYLNYLAQQAGGLTDAQFYRDPTFSNRTRNWFKVDWRLLSAKLEHRFSAQTNASLNIYGLDAARSAVGFRTNRVSQQDDPEAPRDLIAGTFQNWGVEARLIHRYKLRGKTAVALIGGKLYSADNTAIQGPGSASEEPDFELASTSFPYYANQSDFRFPNFNAALFGEHIIYLNDQLTITPGVRLEHIRTQSEGTYRKIDFDLAQNPIRDQLFEDNRSFNRNFALLGLGLSYKPSDALEVYGNWSQNYRSVTFSDIRVVNPSFQVDPNITDESGFTADVGVRGTWKSIAYNFTAYGLLYNDRLGEVLRAETRETAEGEMVETGRIIRFRGNIGRALIYGLESLIEWKVLKSSVSHSHNYQLNLFLNTALTDSRYLESETAGVTDNQVEFIPTINLKTGLRFHYDGFEASLQYTYLSDQYTDASNAEQDKRDNQSGITGAIPAYNIVDYSMSYQFWKHFKLEAGVNNALNSSYFTRRATGYPGPGIIPAAPRSWYLGLEMVF
jgi:Fe(3+) dicitrate transport protein